MHVFREHNAEADATADEAKSTLKPVIPGIKLIKDSFGDFKEINKIEASFDGSGGERCTGSGGWFRAGRIDGTWSPCLKVMVKGKGSALRAEQTASVALTVTVLLTICHVYKCGNKFQRDEKWQKEDLSTIRDRLRQYIKRHYD